MWRLSRNSNSLVDKLMSTFRDETWRRNKRMTSTVLCKSQRRFILERVRDFEQRSFWKVEKRNVLPKLPLEASLKIDILSLHISYYRYLFVSDLMLSVCTFSFIIVRSDENSEEIDAYEKKTTIPYILHFFIYFIYPFPYLIHSLSIIMI